MNPTRLLSTSTFRLTLLYAAIFSISGVLLLAGVYFYSVRFMEQQTQESIEIELNGLLDQYAVNGLDSLIRLIDANAEFRRDRSSIYVLYEPSSLILGNYSFVAGHQITVPPQKPSGPFFRLSVETSDPQDHRNTHAFLAGWAELNNGYRVIVGRDIEDRIAVQRLLRTAIAVGAGLLLFLSFGGGLVMSRWMLHRLEGINQATQEIMAGDLGRRIVTNGGGDEFDELAQNLNAMLERIERLLEGMREVTNNVAHDLRTPLTRMRSRIEVALMRADHNDETREVLEGTVRDAEGLINTFNALLNIAKAEAGEQQSEWEGVDLAELARDVAELYEPLAEERQLAFTLDAATGVQATGNRHLIAQALANLVDNAIKYTPEGGRVTMEVKASPRPTIVVTDTGRGIPPELREKALERFVRLESDRSTPGSGLGLSLVNAVAKLHDATLAMGDNQPGLRVELAFRSRSPQGSPSPLKTALSPV